MARTVACALVNSRLDYASSVLYGTSVDKHCETTPRTERICPSCHIQAASLSYSSSAWKPPLAASKVPYRLQGGLACLHGQLAAQLISGRRLATTHLPDSFGRQYSSSYWSHQSELNLQNVFSQAAPTVWNNWFFFLTTYGA